MWKTLAFGAALFGVIASLPTPSAASECYPCWGEFCVSHTPEAIAKLKQEGDRTFIIEEVLGTTSAEVGDRLTWESGYPDDLSNIFIAVISSQRGDLLMKPLPIETNGLYECDGMGLSPEAIADMVSSSDCGKKGQSDFGPGACESCGGCGSAGTSQTGLLMITIAIGFMSGRQKTRHS